MSALKAYGILVVFTTVLLSIGGTPLPVTAAGIALFLFGVIVEYTRPK